MFELQSDNKLLPLAGQAGDTESDNSSSLCHFNPIEVPSRKLNYNPPSSHFHFLFYPAYFRFRYLRGVAIWFAKDEGWDFQTRTSQLSVTLESEWTNVSNSISLQCPPLNNWSDWCYLVVRRYWEQPDLSRINPPKDNPPSARLVALNPSANLSQKSSSFDGLSGY